MNISFALLSGILFGLSVPITRLLLAEIEPLLLAGLLYLGAGFGLTMLRFVLQRGALREASLARSDLSWLTASIVLGGITGPVLLFLGLRITPASDTSLLLNFEAVFTVVLAWIFFHEYGGRKMTIGMAAVILGGIVSAWHGVDLLGQFLGHALIILACVCWGIDNNLTRRISASDPAQIVAVKSLIAGSVSVGCALLLRAELPRLTWISAAMVVGFSSYGLSLLLFVFSLRNLGTSRSIAYFSTGPFFGAFASFLILGEAITAPFLGSLTLMSFGIWALVTEEHNHLHVHDQLVHTHRHVHDLHHQHVHGSNDPSSEAHTHLHAHEKQVHSHPHYPDIHHRHKHN